MIRREGMVRRCMNCWQESGKEATGDTKRRCYLAGRVPLATDRRCVWLRWGPISQTIWTRLLTRPAATALLRSRTYLGAQYRRLRTKLGAPKAITAMAHRLARLVYRMLKYGQ